MIRYDPDKNRFIVAAHGINAAPVIKLPMRRWMRKMGVWIVPATRANCKQMIDTMRDWQWDDDALAKATLISSAELRQRRVWPEWYNFTVPPYAHQREACRRAYSEDSYALFMEMGTGKTKVAIDVCCAHALHRHFQLVVVVCPLTVVPVWRREIALHSTVPPIIVHANAKFKGAALQQDSLTWVLVGVESLSQGKVATLLKQWLPLQTFAMVVDESSRIKTPKARRTKNVIALGRYAKVRMALTGTPVTRSLMDLYSQYDFLDPDIIGVGDFYAFRNRYAIMGGYKNKQVIGYDNVDELMGFLRPFTYQIAKKDALDLPPKVYERRYVTLAPTHASRYRSLAGNEMTDYDVSNVLTRILRLQQLVGGFLPDPDDAKCIIPQVLLEDNAKLVELMSVLDEATGQAIIWCRYLPEVYAIVSLLERNAGVSVITGDVKPADRVTAIDEFQNGTNRFFVGTMGAGGIGITLTAASVVVYYSTSTSYEERVQSEDRAHRIGQHKSVTYVDLIAAGTVDELLMAAHDSKLDLDAYVKQRMHDGGSLDYGSG